MRKITSFWIWKVLLKVMINGATKEMVLKDVFVSDASFKLISLLILKNSRFKVYSNSSSGIVTTNFGKVILQVNLDINEKLWTLSTDLSFNCSNHSFFLRKAIQLFQ